MTTESPLYAPLVLLMAGVLGLSVSKALRISPIVGFFALGTLIGSHGLALIDSHMAGLHFLGELGVCFLLFDVGLHLSLKELRQGWRRFITVGVIQTILVTSAITLVVNLAGVSLRSATIIGAILSLSSTALVLKILSDHNEQTSPAGRRATEVLVFQDIVAILLLVLITAGKESLSLTAALKPLGMMALSAIALVTLGRLALKPMFRALVAIRNDEAFTAVALLLVLFTSWITESLGLSLALGAFLGGLALSESSYAYLVRTEVAPFRGLLLSLFFITVGMSLDLGAMAMQWEILILLLAAFIAIKALFNWSAMRLAGVEGPSATRIAFLLSQGSEFAFVLFATAAVNQLIPQQLAERGIAVVGLSLALSPILAGIGCVISRSVCRVSSDSEGLQAQLEEVVIVEFDELAREIAGILEQEGIPYRGHDRDIERLAFAQSRGFNVYYSDPNRPRTLGRASLGKVRAVISLLEDDEIAKELAGGLRKVAADIPIIAATKDPRRLELLLELGIEDAFLKGGNTLPVVIETLFTKLGYSQERTAAAVKRALKSPLDSVLPRAADALHNPETQLAA